MSVCPIGYKRTCAAPVRRHCIADVFQFPVRCHRLVVGFLMTTRLLLTADPKAGYLAHAHEIRAAIDRVLAGGQYILGPEVEAFEREFVFVAVTAQMVRETVLLTGTCEVKESPETACVLAVLDATNRWLMNPRRV